MMIPTSEDTVRKNIPRGFEPPLWPWGQRSKIVTQHSSSYITKFGCKRFKRLRRYGRKSYFLRIWAHTVTLTLKMGTQPFCMTLRVMMMHHHIKFGCIQFSGSEDIFQTVVLQMDTHTIFFDPIYTSPPQLCYKSFTLTKSGRFAIKSLFCHCDQPSNSNDQTQNPINDFIHRSTRVFLS